jgi:hypothetical protein
MAEEAADTPQRWTAKRRATLVLSIMKGETSAQAAARKHGLTVAEIEEWRERFLLGAENALRARPKDEDALKDEQIKRLKQKIGELVLDLDIARPGSPPGAGTGRHPPRWLRVALEPAHVRLALGHGRGRPAVRDKYVRRLVVPGGGIEPPRACAHQILSLARLPSSAIPA